MVVREKTESYDIDAVILWVDGNDPEWIKERSKYKVSQMQDASVARYRDWELLKYIFRSICLFAPWIRKVHLVTCGQKPQWLNVKCEKLNFVVHENIIPHQFLPTFSSQAIDLNLHKIEDLAEHFIYFNDDMILTNYVNASDFFVDGKSRDMFSERPICYSGNVFAHNMMNNMEVLSKRYSRDAVLKKNRNKILNLKYGKYFFYNLIWYLQPYKKFCGLYINHLPMGYKKSTWERVWGYAAEELNNTVSNRFRTMTDLNQFIFQFDALMRGDFYPTNMDKQGRYFSIVDEENDDLYAALIARKYKRICINDNCSEEVFIRTKKKILNHMEKIFPDNCMFEI